MPTETRAIAAASLVRSRSMAPIGGGEVCGKSEVMEGLYGITLIPATKYLLYFENFVMAASRCYTKISGVRWAGRDLREKLALKTMNQAVTRTPEAWMKVLSKAPASIVFSRKMTGKELRSLRESLGLSQREFAEILGVTRVTITRAEGDKPSRMVQSYIDVAFRDGKLAFSVAEPLAEYGKKASKKRAKKGS